jgi:tagaturonate epimerase
MTLNQFIETLKIPASKEGAKYEITTTRGNILSVYTRSVRKEQDAIFFIGLQQTEKYLYIIETGEDIESAQEFEGKHLNEEFGPGFPTKRCSLNAHNARILRKVFQFTKPVVLGIEDSFGFGDRLGIANPAHIRSLEGSHMRPILAQQSIRELDRTQRTAQAVLDAASWATFQEGYTKGFGADADHLKTTDDIDRYAQAGFTMYTFDPSAHVLNEAVTLPLEEVRARAKKLDVPDLQLDDVLLRYADKTFVLDGGLTLKPSDENIARAFLKYGKVVAHTVLLFRYLKEKNSSLETEVELSVDETDIPTTPVEHLFIAGELKRLNVKWVSLAPRFIGDFEKGVDYRGDINAFINEYRLHVGISKMFGPYKISIHSGSDKFSIYKAIGSLHLGNVHVKTAGTSYLEALRTIASVQPGLIREILNFARDRYEEDRKSYHVTGRLDRVPEAINCTDPELIALFDQHDARQVFHVTFGKVLTTNDEKGNRLFYNRIMECLKTHEDVHYETIIKHFRKHLIPFAQKK